MKVIWTEKAEKQLNQIFEFIATDSSLYAHRTVGQIIEETESIPSHFQSIPPHPRKGRKVPEYEREDIREVFHQPYRIIYLLKDETIEILSIIHGARLLPDKPK